MHKFTQKYRNVNDMAQTCVVLTYSYVILMVIVRFVEIPVKVKVSVVQTCFIVLLEWTLSSLFLGVESHIQLQSLPQWRLSEHPGYM